MPITIMQMYGKMKKKGEKGKMDPSMMKKKKGAKKPPMKKKK